MPDQRSAMKEYRQLDQKRAGQGLTPDEEARYARLRDLVGGEAAGASGGGFDVNAAAARLRESLLPAGLRNRPPPEPLLEEAPLAAPDPVPGAIDAGALSLAWPDAPVTPGEPEQQGADFFDPASLGQDGADAAQAWDPDAQPYDPNAPAAYDPNAVQAWDSNAQPYDPNAAAAYDPNAVQAWDPNAQPYDPNAAAAYDPNAAQAWDPNAQPYDPNAAAAYDPNAAQVWDPNAQPYDPNAAAAYDPNAAQVWDPNAQPYDPNAVAAYDPDAAQAWDPNAQPYDPNAAAEYDPNAAQAWDPNAQPDPNAPAEYDPNAAQAWDPNAQPDPNAPAAFDPESAQASDPNAVAADDATAPEAWDPNAQPFDLNAAAAVHDPNVAWGLDAEPYDPNAAAAYDPSAAQVWDPNAQPYDPNAAQAWEQDAQPLEPEALALDPVEASLDLGGEPAPEAPATWSADAGWETGAMPDAGPGLAGSLAAALDLAGTDPSAEPGAAPPAEPLPPLALGGYDELDLSPVAPESAAPDGGLASALPFDAAAFAEGQADLGAELGLDPELASRGPVTLGAYDDLAGFERAPRALDLPADEPGFRAASGRDGAAPSGWQADSALEDGFHLESSGSFELTEEELAPPEATFTASPAGAPGLDDDAVEVMDLAEADLAGELGDAPGGGDAAAAQGATGDGALAGAAARFEPERADAPGGDLPAEPAGASAPSDLEELPTIEGEEILEELPPEDAAAPPALDFAPLEPQGTAAQAWESPAAAPEPEAEAHPAAAPEPPEALAPPQPSAVAAVAAPEAPPADPAPASAGALVEGVHRVVVHTLEGQVKRGVLESPDLAAAVLGLAPQPGGSAEVIATDKVKAIFFMLAPGEKAPPPEGHKVRVTFRDGRQVAGFSPDYREDAVGFFMVPADTRTNTGRIWVYRGAVRQVSVT